MFAELLNLFGEWSLECFSALGVREHPNSESMLFLLVRVITRAHVCLLGEGAPELKMVLPMGVRIFYSQKILDVWLALGIVWIFPTVFTFILSFWDAFSCYLM